MSFGKIKNEYQLLMIVFLKLTNQYFLIKTNRQIIFI